METLEALQRRIETGRDLQSIVRTMKTLSAVTIRRCETASRAVRSYDETVDLGLQILLRNADVADRAIRASEQADASGPVGIIALGTDHGLCGRFNDLVATETGAQIEKYPADPVRTVAVGVRVADLIEAGGCLPAAIYSMPGSVTGIRETTRALLSLIEDWRETQGIARVRIVHNVHSADGRTMPVAMSLLPISPAFLRHQAGRPWPSRRLPTYFENRDTVLARLLEQHVFVRIYRAIAESQVSEHAARLSSMQAAERGIRDRLSEMDAAYRSRRQEQITTELLDIVAGAAASGLDNR